MLLEDLASAANIGDYNKNLKKLQLPSDEKNQIQEVIKKYLCDERIEYFFKYLIPDTAKVHFREYSGEVSGQQVQCITPGNPDIRKLLAGRIYQFRNAVFHAKRTRSGKKTHHFRPFQREDTDIIEHEALLLRFVAQEIIRQAEVDI